MPRRLALVRTIGAAIRARPISTTIQPCEPLLATVAMPRSARSAPTIIMASMPQPRGVPSMSEPQKGVADTDRGAGTSGVWIVRTSAE